MNQVVAARILTRESHTVVIANNGQEAVDLYQHQPFDILLMDVTMPVLDGYDASRLIRQIEQKTGRHVPIIAMTARAMIGDRERCLEAGMDEYLSKPIHRELLFRKMAKLVPPRPRAARNSASRAGEVGCRVARPNHQPDRSQCVARPERLVDASPREHEGPRRRYQDVPGRASKTHDRDPPRYRKPRL